MADVPPPPPPNGDDDELAKSEREFLAAGREMPELTDAKRDLIKEFANLRTVVFWCARLFVRIAALLLVGAVVIWWWHLIAPSGARWLGDDEVSHLQGLISSGAVAALVTAMGKRVLDP